MNLSDFSETLRRMKMAATQTAVPAVKGNGAVKRKARGEGPLQIFFVNSKGEEHRRVSTDSVLLRAKAAGTHKDYDPTSYAPEVLRALALFALSTRGKTQVANHVTADGANALALLDGVQGELVNGKLYAKTETKTGAPRGKKPDFALYADAYKQAAAWMAKRGKTRTDKDGNEVPIKALTDQEYADLVVQLQTASSEDFKKRTATWAKNGVFRKMFQTLKAQRMTIDDGEAFEDAF